MIICSKHEGNGTYREFILDDAILDAEVQVKTHLAHRSEEGMIAEDAWTEAGVITRAPEGVKAAVATSRRQRGKGALVKLDELFTNEIAALQAIALHYEAPARAAN
jgi:hypothetical protein